MIKSKQLAKAILELSEEGVPDLAEKFLLFMKKNGLESQIPNVILRLEQLQNTAQEKRGIQIEVPHEISNHLVNEIKSFLKADDLDSYVKENKSLIAGFRAKWKGKLYDASLATGLKRLQGLISAR